VALFGTPGGNFARAPRLRSIVGEHSIASLRPIVCLNCPSSFKGNGTLVILPKSHARRRLHERHWRLHRASDDRGKEASQQRAKSTWGQLRLGRKDADTNRE